MPLTSEEDISKVIDRLAKTKPGDNRQEYSQPQSDGLSPQTRATLKKLGARMTPAPQQPSPSDAAMGILDMLIPGFSAMTTPNPFTSLPAATPPIAPGPASPPMASASAAPPAPPTAAPASPVTAPVAAAPAQAGPTPATLPAQGTSGNPGADAAAVLSALGMHPHADPVPAGLLPADPPTYDDSGVGAHAGDISKVMAVLSALGLVNKHFAAVNTPYMEKALHDAQVATADDNYKRAMEDFEARRQLAGDYRNADIKQQQMDLREQNLGLEAQRISDAQKKTFDALHGSLLKQMEHLQDPNHPEEELRAQRAAFDDALPILQKLNPDYTGDEFFRSDTAGNKIFVGHHNVLAAGDKQASIDYKNARVQGKKVQDLRDIARTLSDPHFADMSDDNKQLFVSQAEGLMGLAPGTLDVPQPGQSFDQQLKAKGLAERWASLKERIHEDVVHDAQKADANKWLILNRQSEIQARQSLMSHRTWQEMNGGKSKDPNSLSYNQLLTQRNAAERLVSSLTKQRDDIKQSFTRTPDQDKALQSQIEDAMAVYNHLQNLVLDRQNSAVPDDNPDLPRPRGSVGPVGPAITPLPGLPPPTAASPKPTFTAKDKNGRVWSFRIKP